MNRTVGYHGPVSDSQVVTDNPLDHGMPPPPIVTVSEILTVVAIYNMPPWPQQSVTQQRDTIRLVLQRRNTPTSRSQAGQIGLGNPNYANLQIVDS